MPSKSAIFTFYSCRKQKPPNCTTRTHREMFPLAKYGCIKHGRASALLSSNLLFICSCITAIDCNFRNHFYLFCDFFSPSTSVCSCIRQHTLCERQFFSPVACHNKIGKSNQRYSLVFLCFPATVCRSLFGGFVLQPHKFAMNFP